MKHPSENYQKSIRLSEIFYSIQGESYYMGFPCIFVRTTGCDLRCEWCDTEYAFYGGEKWTIARIVDHLEQWPCKLVELTGGEPLLQKYIPVLGEILLERDYTVLIETGGHRDISCLDPRIVKIIDLKCPGSGENDKIFWPNLKRLEAKDQIKFVIKDRADYEWTKEIIHRFALTEGPQLLVSPVFGVMNYEQLAGWILEDGLKVRMQLQLHKFIWDPEARGV